jgi:pilus assembly protein CpaC
MEAGPLVSFAFYVCLAIALFLLVEFAYLSIIAPFKRRRSINRRLGAHLARKNVEQALTILKSERGLLDRELPFMRGLQKLIVQSGLRMTVRRFLALTVLIDGQVPSAPAAEKAMAIARDFAGDDVTNSLSIASLQQVNLEVRMIEVARSAGKELGFNWNLVNNGNGFAQGSGVIADASEASAKTGLLAVAGGLSGVLPFATVVANILDNGTSPDLLISALESRNLARRLAEPNLTALSGEQANFQAGGEVPVQTCQGTLAQRDCSVTYKDFGVKLDFTPTVLDDGLINLLIAPEVSEIDPTISVDGNPGFVTRRAKTSVELRDGQSFAIAGLLQSLNAKTASQVPWAGDVPIIGTLFRSSAFQKKESDLVIIVTPRLVRPVGTRQQLQTPLDSMVPSNEPEFFLLGQQEVSKKSLDVKYNGVYGHIIDLPKVDHGSPQK